MKQAKLDNLVSLSMLAVSLVVLFLVAWPRVAPPTTSTDLPPEAPPPSGPIDIRRSPEMGSLAAPVVVLIVSDFICPACKTLAQTELHWIKENYVSPGLVRVVFKPFPVRTPHDIAFTVAAAALCAGDQGRFWEMHDSIFGRAPNAKEAPLGLEGVRADLARMSTALGLDGRAQTSCIDSSGISDAYFHAGSVLAIGVQRTPTILVGKAVGRGSFSATSKLVGVPTRQDLRAAIDEAGGWTR